MKKTLDTAHTLFDPKTAEKIAAELNESDPDWTYKAVHDPKGAGWSYIEIFDENNEFIGRW